jgi:hypothetical protein
LTNGKSFAKIGATRKSADGKKYLFQKFQREPGQVRTGSGEMRKFFPELQC